MRISDWISDVCSSDLDRLGADRYRDLDPLCRDAGVGRHDHGARGVGRAAADEGGAAAACAQAAPPSDGRQSAAALAFLSLGPLYLAARAAAARRRGDRKSVV